MIYRQNNSFLRYNEYPFSSHIQTHEESGYRRFCQPHNHTAIEIVRVLTGSFKMLVNGETLYANEGDILFFGPFDIHAISSEVVCAMQVINFDLSILENGANEKYRSMIESLEDGTLRIKTAVRADEPLAISLASIMERIHGSYGTRSKTASFMRIVAGLYELFALLYEEGAISRDTENNAENSTKTQFARRAVRYVSENFARTISTRDVAAALHLDKSYFCRTFRAVFDQTFVDYLHEYRISVAKNFNPQSGRTLGDIAEAVGYVSYDTFAVQFKRYTGMTPKQYFGKTVSTI